MILAGSTGVGIDIGTKRIKMAKVKRVRDKVEPVAFAVRDTPPTAVDAGVITDVSSLAPVLAEMADEVGLKGSRVVAAVGGRQVYTRLLVMPEMKRRELKEAATYQAAEFLPIPVEEAIIDIYPVRKLASEEGRKVEAFFVAARRPQVEALLAVLKEAGLKPVAVDIEPLALFRLYRCEGKEPQAFLNIGASRSYLAVFEGKVLTALRHLAFGCGAFYQEAEQKGEIDNFCLEDIDIAGEHSPSYLMADIVAELSRTMDYYSMQNGGRRIERVLVMGGGSRIGGVDRYLSANLGCRVEIGDLGRTVKLPPSLGAEQRLDLIHDFPVALGLAARGVR